MGLPTSIRVGYFCITTFVGIVLMLLAWWKAGNVLVAVVGSAIVVSASLAVVYTMGDHFQRWCRRVEADG